MPSGKVHDRITYLSAVPACVAAHAAVGSWEPALILAGGLLFGGLMFGPDLDVKSVQYYRWGPLRWIWWPYQRMFRHRSPWTHGLVWGLGVRIAYLAIVSGLLAAVAFALIHTYVRPIPWRLEATTIRGWLLTPSSRQVLWALMGLWAGGALHTIADVTVSAVKRWFRPARKRR